MPQELLVEILVRLPVKSLVKCTSVCKSWCSFITSHVFKTHHLKHSTAFNNPKELLYKDSPFTGDRFFYIHDGDHVEVIERLFGIRPGFSLIVVGSSNGLVCLVENLGRTDNFVLWNPSIEKTLLIPMPNVPYSSYGNGESLCGFSFGFGFDSKSDYYKLVRLVYVGVSEFRSPSVEVYSLRNNCWRSIKHDVNLEIMSLTTCAFCNGACHWLARSRLQNGNRYKMLRFSLEDEVFGETELPDCFAGEDLSTMSFGISDGSLSLVPFTILPELERLSVWSMENYGGVRSWSRSLVGNSVGWLKNLIGCMKGQALLSCVI